MRRPAATIVALVMTVLAAGCGADEEQDAGPRTGATQTVTAPGATQTVAIPGATQIPAPADTQTSTAGQLPPAAAADLRRGGRAAQRAVPAVRDCLSRQGYRVTGGAARSGDADAPDYQILVSGQRGSAFVAFYDTLARARRFERKVRRNASKVKSASVDRHGTITVVWVSLTDRAARARIRDCIVQES